MAGPWGCMIVDVKTRNILLICTATILGLFIVGILIGYVTGKGPSNTIQEHESVAQAIRASCNSPTPVTAAAKTYFDRFVERHSEKYACVNKPTECWNDGLPRHYTAYHLNGKSINMDGKLDDEAWNEVPWSDVFVDMRSVVYNKPVYDTKFKIRWDTDRLYIGAYIEEKNMWATHQQHDSSIWRENGLDILIDVDGSMFNYKQVEINVLGTMLDLMMYKSPHDATWKTSTNMEWHAHAEKAVHTEGTVNTPGDEDKFWSVELSLPFQTLAENSQRVHPDPVENEVWFIQFGRVEQQLVINNGRYEKAPNSTTDWWAWQPCGAINLHLQDRWGLVQFKKNRQETVFRFDKWHIYRCLFDMVDAMKIYKAINGFYSDAIEELDVPPYLLSGTCVAVPEISILRNENGTDFDVAIKSNMLSQVTGHVNSEKYVTFR